MKPKRVLALVIFAALAAVAASAWAPDRTVESLKPRWAAAPSRFETIDGMAVHLRDQGPRDDPHPLVLIHGTSSSLHAWDAWAARLQGGHRVLSFDLPGFGLTGPFPNDDYSMAHYTRFMSDLLAHLGISHAVLVGNSLGGHVAWETALAHPELVERLVLIDSRGYPVDPASWPVAWRVLRIPVLGSLSNHFLPRGLVEKSVKRVYGDPARVRPELVDRYYELSLRAGNRRALMLALRQALQSRDAQDADAVRIRTLSIPTLILWGRLDRVVPLADAQRFHQDIAGSRLVVFDGLGHVPEEEDPDTSLEALNAFLSSPGAATASNNGSGT